MPMSQKKIKLSLSLKEGEGSCIESTKIPLLFPENPNS